MRIILIALIGVHGLIHLLGFNKAFGIYELKILNLPISKISGLFWLLAFLLFAVTLVQFLIRSEYWWSFGLIALIASQILILCFWSDAKFGTIANFILLLAVIIAYSNYHFKNVIQQERVLLFNKSENISERIVHTDDLSILPPVVQKWLTNSGVVGTPMISNVYLIQELQLKLKPEQEEWNRGTAEQYFTIQPPAFNWNLTTQMSPSVSIAGRDKFENGKGEMLIKLFSVIPVADVKNDEKVNQATLQRFLAEIVWFPSAAFSNHIQWEDLDSNSVKATMEYNGTKGSGIFYFDQDRQFKKFVALRYKDVHDTKPTKWTVTASKIEERNGIKIPTECEASWSLDTEKWTWLKLKIKHIEYNVKNHPN